MVQELSAAPLILSFSPLGEGTPEQAFPLPGGEGQGEGSERRSFPHKVPRL
jgi:hypothetical protein